MKNRSLFSLIGALCLASCGSSSVEGWQTSDLRLLPLEGYGDTAVVYVDTETGQETGWGGFGSATLFYDGFALTTREGEGYRFLNKKGEPLGENFYYDATIFHDGIAWAVRPGGPLTAIDKSGNTLFEFKSAETACAFHDGAAAFCNAEGLWGLVDTKGNILVEPCWTDVVPMIVDGLIAAKDAVLGKYLLARCYFYGEGTAQDMNKAYTLLCDLNGNRNADKWILHNVYSLLGHCYEFGWGTEAKPWQAIQNYEKTEHPGWLYRAASLMDAQNKVFDSLCRSAEMGYGPAQKLLGDWYKEGKGTPVNLVKSREWYAKAKANGEEVPE